MGVRAIGIIGLAMFGTADNVFQFERVGGRAWRYGHHTESGEAFQESDLSDGGSGLPYRSEGQFRSLQIFEVSLLCGADGYVAICKL